MKGAARIGTAVAMVAGLLLAATPARADGGRTNDGGTALALEVCDLGIVSLLGVDLSNCDTGSDDRHGSRIRNQDRDSWVFWNEPEGWRAWRR